MALPKIIKDRVDLEVSPQLRVSLFPEDQGQPKIDIVQVQLTQLEGTKTDLFLTPCEALELSAALSQIVQFYLYNQEQYRKEILIPRQKQVPLREKRKLRARGPVNKAPASEVGDRRFNSCRAHHNRNRQK